MAHPLGDFTRPTHSLAFHQLDFLSPGPLSNGASSAGLVATEAKIREVRSKITSCQENLIRLSPQEEALNSTILELREQQKAAIQPDRARSAFIPISLAKVNREISTVATKIRIIRDNMDELHKTLRQLREEERSLSSRLVELRNPEQKRKDSPPPTPSKRPCTPYVRGKKQLEFFRHIYREEHLEEYHQRGTFYYCQDGSFQEVRILKFQNFTNVTIRNQNSELITVSCYDLIFTPKHTDRFFIRVEKGRQGPLYYKIAKLSQILVYAEMLKTKSVLTRKATCSYLNPNPPQFDKECRTYIQQFIDVLPFPPESRQADELLVQRDPDETPGVFRFRPQE